MQQLWVINVKELLKQNVNVSGETRPPSVPLLFISQASSQTVHNIAEYCTGALLLPHSKTYHVAGGRTL